MSTVARSNTCILLLACKDYESTQISIAALLASTPVEVPIFFIPNCKGTFDTERVRELGVLYSKLHHNRFHFLEDVEPDVPYVTINKLLSSSEFSDFEFVCKIDDDVFPITYDWLDKLIHTYNQYSESIAYATGLINNNPWGFKYLVDKLDLGDTYQGLVGEQSESGSKEDGYHEKKVGKEVDGGGWGTVWQFPHLAKWIHELTTLDPNRYCEVSKNWGDEFVDHNQRYSIGCILFKKGLWSEIGNNIDTDDEKLFHLYCRRENKRIVCSTSTPLVHLFFFNQRLYNKPILGEVYDIYSRYFGDKFVTFNDFSTSFKLNYIEERLRKSEENMADILEHLESHSLLGIVKRVLRAVPGSRKLARYINAEIRPTLAKVPYARKLKKYFGSL